MGYEDYFYYTMVTQFSFSLPSALIVLSPLYDYCSLLRQIVFSDYISPPEQSFLFFPLEIITASFSSLKWYQYITFRKQFIICQELLCEFIIYCLQFVHYWVSRGEKAFPGGLDGVESAWNAGVSRRYILIPISQIRACLGSPSQAGISSENPSQALFI